MNAGERANPLGPYRVLDLTDERGLLCGEILGDLGADVIAVEPPAGNTARRVGPFAGDVASDPEASLTWAAYARNKRSVVIDIATDEGRNQLEELVRGADFFIQSFDPGYLAELGLGYEVLAEINPGLIYVSISPFGQTGPKAAYAATDLVVMAASGPMSTTGDADRAPVRMGLPQSALHAGAEAAGAALIAHREKLRSGRGQHIDVSAQLAVAQATQSFILAHALGDMSLARVTGGVAISGMKLPLVWQAKNGYVSLTFFFGTSMAPFARRLMEWIFEEGACDAAMRDKDWDAYGVLLVSGEESFEEFDRVLAAIEAFLKTKTKEELLTQAMERRLLIVPISSLEDLRDSPQFAHRDFWRDLETPSLDQTVRTPGPFAKFSATPLEHRRGAPRIGQHSAEVFAEAMRASTPTAPRPDADTDRGELPLAGLKILDFMWVMAGPAATRVLKDYGATIVKVESTTSLDTARGIQPYKNGVPEPEHSGLFHNLNAGKLGLTLNLASEEGRSVVRDLTRWADIVCESFSPKAMRGWGLGYEQLREVNPELIMMSSCLFGQSGPYSGIAGFGTMGAAAGGFNALSGWPDRAPAMVAAYTDYTAPRYAIAALMAALDHRDRTGEGQYIDLSQAEASVNFLGPAFLDLLINGRNFERLGNADPQMAPHAAFPAVGTDRWVAIACRDDGDWRALLEVSGLTDLALDARFATLETRLLNREALEVAIGRWTRQHEMGALERMLQDRGVPAHQLQNSPELAVDPQLLHRKHFIELPHATMGTVTIEGSRFELSRTPAKVEFAGPTFGEHNHYVLQEILGYDDQRIAELTDAKVLM
ncbi:MAG: CoA transferase [Pseudomonadales bacterium]|jgi:crotonobetainyl-CoA:carnitine CoA-transferase CaiB-like acyl-CoA transferase